MRAAAGLRPDAILLFLITLAVGLPGLEARAKALGKRKARPCSGAAKPAPAFKRQRHSGFEMVPLRARAAVRRAAKRDRPEAPGRTFTDVMTRCRSDGLEGHHGPAWIIGLHQQPHRSSRAHGTPSHRLDEFYLATKTPQGHWEAARLGRFATGSGADYVKKHDVTAVGRNVSIAVTGGSPLRAYGLELRPVDAVKVIQGEELARRHNDTGIQTVYFRGSSKEPRADRGLRVAVTQIVGAPEPASPLRPTRAVRARHPGSTRRGPGPAQTAVHP